MPASFDGAPPAASGGENKSSGGTPSADSEAVDNNVEAYISFLRKKLAFVGAHVTITARRKVGYRLEESDA